MKKLILFIVLLLLMLIIGGSIYYFSKKETKTTPAFQPLPENQETKIEHSSCLTPEEWASFKIEREGKYGEGVGYSKGKAIIYLKEKNTNREISNFQIESIDPDHYHPLEIHKCAVYGFRWFDLDELTTLYKRYEFWYYTYDGKGRMLLSKKDLSPYSLDFRINETETYIALVRGWVGEPENHALVIKDLKTMEDKDVITLKELLDRFPNVEPGTIRLNYWGNERFETGDIFSFELLNPERPYFGFNIRTKKIETGE